MANIPVGQKIKIFSIGFVASALLYFIFQTLLASIIVDVFIGTFDDQFILFLIILGFEFIALITSILVSLWIAENIQRRSIYKAALFAYLFNLIILITISYISLFILYPEVFSEVSGLDVIWIFPSVMVDFANYVLGLPIFFFIFSIFLYNLLYVILLEKTYKYKSRYQ